MAQSSPQLLHSIIGGDWIIWLSDRSDDYVDYLAGVKISNAVSDNVFCSVAMITLFALFFPR